LQARLDDSRRSTARRGPLRDPADPFRLTENSVQRQITGHLQATAAAMTEVGEWLITA
jgi:hypothetical protein